MKHKIDVLFQDLLLDILEVNNYIENGNKERVVLLAEIEIIEAQIQMLCLDYREIEIVTNAIREMKLKLGASRLANR